MANNATVDKHIAFENQVLEAAENQATEIIKQAEHYRMEELRGVSKNFGNEVYAKKQRQTLQDEQRRLSQGEKEYKRQLLIYREQLASELFADVELKLKEFVQSESYISYLLSKISNHEDMEIDNLPCVVFMRKEDEYHKETISKIISGCDFAVDSSIKIGGVKLSNGRMLYDETLDCALADEKERFFNYCDLRV